MNIRKYLPIILFAVGILVVVGAFLIVRSKSSDNGTEEEEDTSAMIEVQLENRPVAMLTPRAGYWLDLVITKLGLFEAASVDYELVYKVPDSTSQGTGGSVKLTGQDSIDKEILLGSESSGNYYYDEGVEEGTLSLKFRNDKGRLIAKFTTEFHLQTNVDKLTSLDGNFELTLGESSKDYFVTMMTIGVPEAYEGTPSENIYGVFSSSGDPAIFATSN